MATEYVDIICETEPQLNETLARLNDSGFRWSDDVELFGDEDVLEEIRAEVREWDIFLRVSSDDHVEWNVMAYRNEDEKIPAIPAQNYLPRPNMQHTRTMILMQERISSSVRPPSCMLY